MRFPCHLPVAFAGAFLGLPGLLVTLSMSAAMRLFIGGYGAVPGIVSMTIAGVMGLAWTRGVRGDRPASVPRLFALSVMVSTNLVAALLLPWDLAVAFFTTLAPVLVVIDLVTVFTLGAFFERERKLVRRERELSLSADTDLLTGLLNRRGLLRRLGAAAPRGRDKGHAVLLLDLDHFKAVNDTHGHKAGDIVLRETARRLTTALRGEDLVARFGGEEFVVHLPDATHAEADRVAERLRRTIEQEAFSLPDAALALSTSIGGSWGLRDRRFERLLAEADEALYTAKAAGRDRVVFSLNAAPDFARAA